jgi:DNA-binding CsgD family transcriptional regulator
VSYEARRRLAERVERWWAEVERPPVAFFDRFLHAARAVDLACAGGPRTAISLAEAAIAPGMSGDHLGRHIGLLAAYAFLVAERFDRVEAVLTALADAVAARGGAQTLAVIGAQRALLGFHRGHVTAAESEAVEALTVTGELDAPPAYLFTAAATLLWVAAERGEPPHPLAAPARDDGDSLFGRHLTYARAVLDVAEGRVEQGAAALLGVGERERAIGWKGASQFPWRSDAALALAAIGERSRARRLVDDELELARVAGAPRALGIARRASALLSGGDERVRLLEQAVASLEGSGADLDHARALVDLGAALRRRDATAARATLRRGYDLAVRCGATRLAEHAREELLASGARPRRVALSGREALTPSERRVVELAARGMMNREIAQALFVTEKTVETHLTHAYSKLGVSSRRDVAGALAAN